MRLTSPGGGFQDFRDRNPLIIHLDVNDAFVANVTPVGFDYTVPAGRSAFIDFAHMVLQLNSTIAPGGSMRVNMQFFLPPGPFQSTVVALLAAGEGPGQWSAVNVSGGQMSAGARYLAAVGLVVPTPAGIFRTVIHGVEYDE